LERRFSAMINRNQIRENETDFAVFGLNAREDKTVDQDGEALSTRDRTDNVLRLPGLSEDFGVVRVAGTVDETLVVSPSG
jgi:hypothetical protein